MNITIPVPITTKEFSDIEAEMLFEIAPHLASAGTFAVHRSIMWKQWEVTNVETGMWIAKDSSKAKVIKRAEAMLAKKTPDDLLGAYRKALRLHPHLYGQL